ncbi:G protein-activated inward rectifier potassium channel 4-like [Actinia tenebrosa]|uniref:G protein-activated inward rectifier potassium channel 4-like n=1 Tax=Actinia tenebrosa TaxID=6105 RepID=A0A6P8I2K3_ACTTE|nr:G protein-activated inward rectifier potassium channel 4-like [Actinia tenebrosa]
MEPNNPQESCQENQTSMQEQPSFMSKPSLSTITRKLTRFLSTDQQLAQDKKARLIAKRGRVNILVSNVQRRNLLYLSDLFTTLIDCKWYWIFLVFSASFLSSWLIFGSLWWFITWLRDGQEHGSITCVENVNSWTSAFLFSIETQTTIGYGGRQITTDCPEGILCLLIQSLTGLSLSASLVGLIFAKISRPRPRSQTVVFSKHAVIALRNNAMTLSFRVGDIRKSQLLEVTVKLHLFRYQNKRDNEKVLLDQIELPLKISPGSEPDYEVRPFFLTPLTVSHVIDEKSPFYELSAKDVRDADLELVAVLEGVVEATGMVTQARTSYLPHEILWGHEFCPLSIHTGLANNRVHLDFSCFDKTYPVIGNPKCSAKESQEKNESLYMASNGLDTFVPGKERAS